MQCGLDWGIYMLAKTQITTDKFAMTLSLGCLVHCLFTPSFLILTSGFFSLSLDNEFIHKFIVFLAVPTSIFALTVGYRNHKTTSFLPCGILGLLMLVSAVMLGEAALGELGEKGLTMFGAILVAYSHFKNYQICKNLDCSCHEA